jgi:hypothetical protein
MAAADVVYAESSQYQPYDVQRLTHSALLNCMGTGGSFNQ